MVGHSRSRVKTLLVAENSRVQLRLSHMLASEGFTDLTVVDALDSFAEALSTSNVDLLICVSQLDAGAAGDLIHDIRHGIVGNHPFPIILMMLLSSDEKYVKAALEAGPDDLLVAPISKNELPRRISSLAAERRPFVITHNYIGPERRFSPRPDATSAPAFRVPNPVRSKIAGLSDEAIQQAIDDASHLLNRCKIGRNGVQMSWLVDRVREHMDVATAGQHALRDLIVEIYHSAMDISRRAVLRKEQLLQQQALAVSVATMEISQSSDIAADPRFTDVIEISAALGRVSAGAAYAA